MVTLYRVFEKAIVNVKNPFWYLRKSPNDVDDVVESNYYNPIGGDEKKILK